jgi:hypothetical protein
VSLPSLERGSTSRRRCLTPALPLFLLACSAAIPTSPSAGWSHQPPGFNVWTDWGIDGLTGSGWGVNDASGYATVVADAGAPFSAPNVGQWRYPVGFAGGNAPATMFHPLPPAFTEGFVGVWWKPSRPWQGHPSGVNKIYFLLGGSCGNLIPVMYGPPGGPYQLRVAPEWGSNWSWLTPNVNAVPIALGAWHRIELYFKYNTPGSANGVVRWWMDGAVIGDYANVSFPGDGCFSEFQFSPTWGGVGDAKTETDYFWFDHVMISYPTAAAAAATRPPAMVQEDFQDGALAARGWYDNTAALLSATERVGAGGHSIEYRFLAGATTPTAGGTLRRKFPAADSVYLGYYVKYSPNWVGSQKAYHPHEFMLLTNLNDDWAGPSFTRLTAYVEQNGGTPRLAIQDGENVDQASIGRDLTAVTENRGVAGCNGSSDGQPDDCYQAGGVHVNEKKWSASSRLFADAPGPFYKSDWHFVEAYIKLNTISGGKGVSDGVLQYWLDGQPAIDRRDVLLRTGAHPTMQFNQLVIAPYIGDGSPVTQSMWVDNVTVATGRP